MPAKVDAKKAEAVMNRAGLKTLEPYTHSKKPWKSRHIKCGRIVSPTYNAIQRGQSGCIFCAGLSVDPKEARKLFLSKGLKPIEPYPGQNKLPWKSIHLKCGREVSPTYNLIQQNYSIGCHFCSDQFVDPDEAYQFFLSKDLQPLIPYPGTAKPWKSIHLICGEVIQPRYGHIKSGRKGCPICSGTVPISQERAEKFFRANGLDPIGKFPGPNRPWKAVHKKCGRNVSPRWANIQQGGNGCAYCAGNKVDMKEVKALLKRLELKPLEPYPGGKVGWNCIHLKCGTKVSPAYSALKNGQGPCEICGKGMVTETEANELLRQNHYSPLSEFPGGSNNWLCLHEVCGTKVNVRAAYLRRGNTGCSFCAGTKPITAAQAYKFFKSRGFKPLEPFRNARTPMKSIHAVCGREVSPTWGSLRASGGCKYCSTSLVNLIAPAYFYLITNRELNSLKIGISGHGATMNRLTRHKKLGWEIYAVKDLDTGEEAYQLEEAILDWIRNDLHLPRYLLSEQMPQGGHTETVDASEIDPSTIWAKVQELSRVIK
jgi:hypothetical protein